MRRESGADGREAGGGFLSVTTYVSVVVCIDGTRALFRSAGPSGHRGFVVALYSLDPADQGTGVFSSQKHFKFSVE